MGVEELQLAVIVRRHEHRQHLAANMRASTLMWMRKSGRAATHRAPSNEIPPPARSLHVRMW